MRIKCPCRQSEDDGDDDDDGDENDIDKRWRRTGTWKTVVDDLIFWLHK